MNQRRSILLVFGCLLASPALAQDWPQYRGPDYDGIAPVQDLFQGKAFGFEVDWIRDLGSGYSSVSVVGDTGVTMHSDGTSNVLMAFDVNTGDERWHVDMGPIYTGHSGSSDGPTSTPTIHDGTVFALDPHGRLAAVSLDEGRKLWAHHLGEDVKARVPHYGFCTSPAVIGDAVILMTGAESGFAFTAFDRRTGDQIWHSGDDTTTYQSPLVWQHGGSKKILALTDHHLMELDPSDGRVLWQQNHTITDNESFTPPVMMETDRLLIMHRHEMAAYELTWNGEAAEMREVWRNPRYPQTYSIPVYYQHHLYYLKGQFLTCLNAQTGEMVWRSRPPGGRAITLVDGHLIIVANNGELVAIEATPAGYSEQARLAVFAERSFTPVSFAHGHLFMRNRSQLARVKVTGQQTLARAQKPVLRGAFGRFVDRLQKATDKKATLDAYMKQQKQFPIIENDNLVHFVFRGEIDDIALVLGFSEEIPLYRVAGTDFYFHTEELDPAGHWEYHFVSYDETRVDALNPLVIGVEPRIRNELRMPQWPVPEFLEKPKRERGRLDSVAFASKIREDERTIKVYLPPGYDRDERRYPLLLVNDGDSALENARMDICLDNLIGTRSAAVIAAFVPTDRSESMGDQRDDYVRLLTEELIPYLDETYRTRSDPATRGIMGAMGGAMISSYAAFKEPAHFGKLANQSFIFLSFRDELRKLISELEPEALDVYVEISSNDFKRSGIDAAEDSRGLLDLLQKSGVSVKEQAVTGAPSWGSWRAQMGIIMEWFAPLRR